MTITRNYLTKNPCYQSGRKITPKGIVVHDTGVNQKRISAYTDNWNRSGVSTCVHAFIGLDDSGKLSVVQTLPWNYRPWGCGSGSKGSYNNSCIQFEICEDGRTDRDYFTQAYQKAVELCAYLCKQYGIDPGNICDHAEAHARGYASNHADTSDWFPRFGKSMGDFRADVTAELKTASASDTLQPYTVRVTASVLNVRRGPGTGYAVVTTVKKGEVYTVTDERNGWGKLKSGAGWISLKYTEKT